MKLTLLGRALVLPSQEVRLTEGSWSLCQEFTDKVTFDGTHLPSGRLPHRSSLITLRMVISWREE